MKLIYLKVLLPYIFAVNGLAILTAGMFAVGKHINPITVGLIFLLFVLFLATVFDSKPALAASVLAMLCFNFFFLPPIGTFTISDPENLIALFAFLVNIQIMIPDGATDLLGNDIDPDTGNNTGLTASGPATTTQNGTLSINANDSFTYNPPPGFEGTDTFTYTVTDAGTATGTGTVTLNVSGMIWFINAGAGGNGTLLSPFNCLVGAGSYSGSANDPNDNIFLYSGDYTGGLTLKNGQKVIGQGAGASLSTITGINPPTGSLTLQTERLTTQERGTL